MFRKLKGYSPLQKYLMHGICWGVRAKFIKSILGLEDRVLILIDLTERISAEEYDELRAVA